MSFNFTDSDRRLESDEAVAYEDAGPHASFGERAVTAVAVTLAILFVSVVAVPLQREYLASNFYNR